MSLLRLILPCILLYVCALSVHGAQTFWPAQVPFAVRSPYLSAWQTTASSSTNDWPGFWNSPVVGWICYIRVDGTTYTLWGNNNLNLPKSVAVIDAGTLQDIQVTPSRTIQVIQAGLMNVTVTFLSPVYPSDLVRQSLPFSYTALEFESTDGNSHDIQVYSDITGEWLCGDRGQEMKWSAPTQTDDIVYHQFELTQPQAFTEVNQQACDGTAYHAMASVQGMSYQVCEDTVCRTEFAVNGTLNSNANNMTVRAINNDWPVFPIAVDLGSVSSSAEPIVWVVGFVRDPSISYTIGGQTEALRPYYTTKYSTVESALSFFITDFNNSLSQAKTLDAQVREEASKVSPDGQLFDMLSLATRQVFSSLEITAPVGQSDEARIFMKDMGMSGRVTPVENLYAALPMFLYYNATLLKPLLVPLLEQQNSAAQFPYAAKDLGTAFPKAPGPTLLLTEAIEQTANMLIITLAHARFANDTSLLSTYYTILESWAQYLKSNGQFPSNQLSVDTGDTLTNSTNLALKAVFGIQAMADISQLLEKKSDFQNFNETAATYMNAWESIALSSGSDPDVLPTFDSALSEWVLPYNIYPQTLFGFDLMSQSVYDKLNASYATLQANNYPHGLPVESIAGSLGNIAWNAFIASTFGEAAQSQLLEALWTCANLTSDGHPFGAIFDVATGALNNGTMSPALGGLFAPFVRSGTVSGSPSPTSSSPGSSKSPGGDSNKGGSHATDVGAIVGGVVGGVVGLLVLLGAALWFVRRRKAQKPASLLDMTGTRTEPTPFEGPPEIVVSPQSPAGYIVSEKRRREMEQRENVPLLPSTAPSSSASGGSTSAPPGDSTISSVSYRSRQDELVGLRSEIADLRRIMLNVQVERPEGSEAPPEYS
ncbi:hypothetical protein FOMPIDRAFT_1054403 [Fomitopsis schrenkii]|uniref:DUF1793-domain-containing protein n=1 Tax=Fomitopsis schrenkii TaxID=2126942 RepID=S8DVN5_FOMSC|nr:hypothetical protein FOMPIDRAFT_1054403 [Fomitopsis schrenkii]